MPIIEAQNISRIFRQGAANEVTALQGVSCAFERREFVVIRGPSGSGKSTLLSLLGALDRPTSGEVLVEGGSLSDASDVQLARVRRRMGIVFQDFALIARLSVLDNILYALIPRRIPPAERREAAGRLLERLQLTQYAGGPADELSGGERQRLALARALAGGPEIVLADEPTSNLDPATAEIVRVLLGEHCENGGAVIAASHDPLLQQMADRELCLQSGRLQ